MFKEVFKETPGSRNCAEVGKTNRKGRAKTESELTVDSPPGLRLRISLRISS